MSTNLRLSKAAAGSPVGRVLNISSPIRKLLSVVRGRMYSLVSLQVAADQEVLPLLRIQAEKSASPKMVAGEYRPV
jgi:hypothetical protein